MKRWFILAIAVALLLPSTGCRQEMSVGYERSYLDIVAVALDDLDQCELTVRVFRDGSPVPRASMTDDFMLSSPDIAINWTGFGRVEQPLVAVHAMLSNAQVGAPAPFEIAGGRYSRHVNCADGFTSGNESDWDTVRKFHPVEDPRNFYASLTAFIANETDELIPQLCVLYLDDKVELTDSAVSDLASLVEDRPNLWLGVFYGGCGPCAEDLLQVLEGELLKRLLFVRPISRYDQEEQVVEIRSALDRIRGADYRVSFSFGEISDPEVLAYGLVAVLGGGATELTDSVVGHVDADLLRSTYTARLGGGVPEPARLSDCSAYLTEARRIFLESGVDSFEEAGIRVLRSCLSDGLHEAQSEQLFEDARDLMRHAEREWDAAAFDWYRPLKTEWYRAFVAFRENSGTSLSQRIEAYELMLELEPTDEPSLFNLYMCRADLAASSGRHEEALRQYEQALAVRPGGVARSRLVAGLVDLIRSQFSAREYGSLYRVAGAYATYVPDNFEFHYILGTSADEIGLAGAALENYLWLHEHWVQDQVHVSWDELVEKLLGLYAANLRFEDGYGFLRDVFVKEEWQSRLDFELVLAYLRGPYLVPFASATHLLFSRADRQARDSFDAELGKLVLNDHVECICRLTNSGGVDQVLYGSEDLLSTPPSRYLGRSCVFATDADVSWLVQPVSGGYIVVQTRATPSSKEDILLSRIADNPTAEESWQALENSIRDSERRVAMELLAIPLGVEFAVSGSKNLQSYDTVLMSMPGAVYAAFQAADSSIAHAWQFDRESLLYEPRAWEASSVAPLFFRNSVERSGQSIAEVGCPLYGMGEWHGVVRIGLGQ